MPAMANSVFTIWFKKEKNIGDNYYKQLLKKVKPDNDNKLCIGTQLL